MSNTESKQRAEQIRKEILNRRPYDGKIMRFSQIPKKVGYETHWFNDTDNDSLGKVVQKLKQGWEFSKRAGFTDSKHDLEKNPNQRIRERVGVIDGDKTLFAYAMDIPEEIYEVYRANKTEKSRKRLKYIQEGKLEETGGLNLKVSTNIQSTNFKPD